MRSNFLRRTIPVIVLLAALALAAIAGAASDTTVTTHRTSKGKVLANSRGFSLYMFKKDKQGGKGKQAKSNCYGSCAKLWPPLLVSKGVKVVAAKGSGLNSKLLGTTKRTDGKLEVTYNGWPLHTNVPDHKPGDIKGEGTDQFGAAWYLLNASGHIICPSNYQRKGSECLPGSY